MFTSFLTKLIQYGKYRLFTPAQQQAFLEDVAILVEDGVIVNQAVEIIHKTTQGTMAEVARTVLTRLAEGRQLADGMRNWFPEPVIEILRAGEQGGTLAESMFAAARTLGQRNSALAALMNAMLYPLLVLCLGLTVTVFVKQSVFASYAAIKPVSEWPSNGQTILALANFVQNGWWVIVLALIAIVVFCARILHNYIGIGRPLLDQIPVLSLYRKFTAARFMETLGLLITNGVVFKKALRILQQTANPYLGAHLLTMEHRLGGGKENIAEVLDTGLLDKNDLARLRVIAQSKGFAHALVRHGRKAAEQNFKLLNAASRIVGMLVLTTGAGLAAYLVMAIYAVGASLSGA